MKGNVVKRALAFCLAGAMVAGGIQIPPIVAKAETTEGIWVWNSELSESGYFKVKKNEIDLSGVTAASASTTEGGSGAPAANAVDGNTGTYWHTSYGNDPSHPTLDEGQGIFTDNNTFTIPLKAAKDLAGITYLPRQNQAGNGIINQLKVEVIKEGSTEWQPVGEGPEWTYSRSNDQWTAGDYQSKDEKEFIFNAVQEGVTQVRITVIKTEGSEGTPNHHINAAEFSLLTERTDNIYQIPAEQLKAKASANSQMAESSGSNDGPAAFAFNGNMENWWHTNWDEDSVTEENIYGNTISEEIPMWIQTSFNQTEYVKHIVYFGRTDQTSNHIQDYILEVANQTDPEEEPEFTEVAKGTFPAPSADGYTITLPEATPATHIRLKATSATPGNEGYVSAALIEVYAAKEKERTGIKVTKLPDKTVYKVGESLDTTGIMVAETYDNGTISQLSAEQLATVVYDGFSAEQGGTKTVNVTYDGLTTTFQVDVAAVQIQNSTLKDITANSQMDPGSNDGPSTNAFDGVADTLWHSRYSGTPGSGEVSSGYVAEGNPIWIQAGFGAVKNLYSITYQGRSNGRNLIGEYEVQVACIDDPENGTVSDADFVTAKTGVLPATTDEQEIVLDEVVEATHVRLVTKSVVATDTNKSKLVCASEIKLYEMAQGADYKVLQSISAQPAAEKYEQGDPLTLTVTASYADGSSADVSGQASVEGYDANTAGQKNVKVIYAGKKTEITVTVEKCADPVLESIEVTTLPETMEYEIGGTFDPKGIGITATYRNSNGNQYTEALSEEEIGQASYDCVTLDTPRKQTVTVTYQNKTATFDVKVNIAVQIPQSILAKRAKANSEQNPQSSADGPASFAFDEDNNTWWHSRWDGSPLPGEVTSGQVTADNPIWIQTGFGEKKNIYSITYLGRSAVAGQNLLNDYEVQVACMENPEQEPTDADFVTAKTGTLPSTNVEHEIVLDKVVEATHIRLVAKTVDYSGSNGSFIAAVEIKVYELKEEAEAVEPVLTGLKAALENASFEQGQEPNLKDLKVQAEYRLGQETQNVDLTVDDPDVIVDLSDYNKNVKGTYTVDITYLGKKAQVQVEVTEPEEKTLRSIEIVQTPEKTSYLIGEAETVNTEGISISAVYTNTYGDSFTEVLSEQELAEVEYSGYSLMKGGDQEVTVTYKGQTAIFKITVRIAVEIDSALLKGNAAASSYQDPAGSSGKDGRAELAFDEDYSDRWHSRYDGARADDETSSGDVTENPIWIQTGFDAVKNIYSITYQGRDEGVNLIGDYEVQIACMENPTEVPTDEDFIVAKTGTLAGTPDEQEIVLDEIVTATHIRLVAKSAIAVTGTSSGYICAKRIRVYELAEAANTVEPVLTGITAALSKTEYAQGEELEGLTVTAQYSIGEAQTIENEKVTVSGYDANQTGEQTVTVVYAGKRVQIQVEVTEPVNKTLTGIEVTKAPNKTQYTVGEEALDLTGIEITASYNDGAIEETLTEEQLADVTCFGYDLTKEGTYTVKATYNEKTDEDAFSITVSEILEIDKNILREHAKANSEQIPVEYDNDGGAELAFNGDTGNWWHSRYDGTPAEHEVADGKAREDNPIWIQTGFGAEKNIHSISYLGRTNNLNTLIKDYEIQIACLEDPTAEPADTDFILAKTGTFVQQHDEAQTVKLDEVVKATHIRLVALSAYTETPEEGDYVTASEIKVFEQAEGSPTPVLTGIEVKAPAKVAYNAGEALVLDGMVVTAKYNKGEDKTIDTDDVIISGYDANVSGVQTISVIYAGKKAAFEVTVTGGTTPKPEKELTKIEVTKKPTKTVYTVGDKEFDSAGMEITATYSDGEEETTEILAVEDVTVSGFDTSKAGTVTIKITYEGKEAAFTITVKTAEVVDPELEKIEITKKPAKMEYELGDKLDLTGIEVTAVYKDGTTKKLTIDDLTVLGFGSTTPGEKRITILYGGKRAELIVTVKEPKVGQVESVTFDAEEKTIVIGRQEQLKVTVMPAGTAETVTWSSSDEEVLTVDEDGNMYALWPGQAEVTAEAGGRSAVLKVTVKGVEAIYDDVPAEQWYYEAGNWAYINGVMTGLNATTFGPDSTLVRAQFAVILYRMAGSPEVEEKAVTGFADVDADAGNSWYRNAVIWASENGIITGYTSNGLFGTNDNITREQAATILYRYLYMNAEKPALTEGEILSSFPDAGDIQPYAKEAMAWAVQKEIIKGSQGYLKPQGNANRAEAATIMWRFAQLDR